jgi:hypothetical protein
MEQYTFVTETIFMPLFRAVTMWVPIFVERHVMGLKLATASVTLGLALVARREARRRAFYDEPMPFTLIMAELSSLAVAQFCACTIKAPVMDDIFGIYATYANIWFKSVLVIARTYAHYRLVLLAGDLGVVSGILYAMRRVWRAWVRDKDIHGALMFAVAKIMGGNDIVGNDGSINAMAQLLVAGMTVRHNNYGVSDSQAEEVRRMLYQPLEAGECLVCRDETQLCGTRLNCCSQYIHAACLLEWVKQYPSCPHCRKTLLSGGLRALQHLQSQFRLFEEARRGGVDPSFRFL